MANQLTQLPWSLDTVAVVATYPVDIHHMEFVDYDVDTDTFEVQDKDGNTVWSGKGNVDLSPVTQGAMSGWANGLQLTSLVGNGRILVYLK
jgi:hypothetical protein